LYIHTEYIFFNFQNMLTLVEIDSLLIEDERIIYLGSECLVMSGQNFRLHVERNGNKLLFD